LGLSVAYAKERRLFRGIRMPTLRRGHLPRTDTQTVRLAKKVLHDLRYKVNGPDYTDVSVLASYVVRRLTKTKKEKA
jgi:hypothetical protein